MVAQVLSIIFISHKLGEVLRVSKPRCRAAWRQAGRRGCHGRHRRQAQLAQWMVGHGVEAASRRPTTARGEVVCALDRVCTPQRGRDTCATCRSRCAGEIVAIAGFWQRAGGTRQPALRHARRRDRHRRLPATRCPRSLIAWCNWRRARPEDRHAVGVVGDLPVRGKRPVRTLRPAMRLAGSVARPRAPTRKPSSVF